MSPPSVAARSLGRCFGPLNPGYCKGSWRRAPRLAAERTFLETLGGLGNVVGLNKSAVDLLFLEPLSSGTLCQRVGVLSAMETHRNTLALISAIERCHTYGIIHRDIKPGNIMFTAEGELRLIDFDVAAFRGARSTLEGHEDVRIGTLPYSAPEQILDPATATYETADIYSLGVVLYEMLTGHIPYYLHDDEDEEAYRLRIPFEEPVPPSVYRSELAPELEAVILKAMSRNPADRHQSIAELRDEVEAAFRAAAARDAEPVAEPSALPPAKARRVLPWLALVPLPALLAWIFLAG